MLYKDGSRIGYRGSNKEEDPNFNTSRFSLNHASLREIRDLIGPNSFNSAIKISSIRNPYDRVVSAFHHLGNHKLNEYIEMKKKGEVNTIRDSFAEYNHKHPSSKYTGHRHFYCDSEMVIDHFVRKEEMVSDLSLVLKKLDVPTDIHKIIIENIPTFKKTSRGESSLKLPDYYTQETLEIVNSRYSEWFDLGRYARISSIQELSQNIS